MTGPVGALLLGSVPVAAAVVLVGLRRSRLVVTVSGDSMAPTLRSGDRVLARRIRSEHLRTGQIVVLRRQHRARDGTVGGHPLIVKRVAAVSGEPVPPGLRAAPVSGTT